MEHLPSAKPSENLVTVIPQHLLKNEVCVPPLNLISVLSPPQPSEAEHLILSLAAKLNHFNDFYFSHWFQLKPSQILDLLTPLLLVEKIPSSRGVCKYPCAISGEAWPRLYFHLSVCSTDNHWDGTPSSVSASTLADSWDGTHLTWSVHPSLWYLHHSQRQPCRTAVSLSPSPPPKLPVPLRRQGPRHSRNTGKTLSVLHMPARPPTMCALSSQDTTTPQRHWGHLHKACHLSRLAGLLFF